jgi:hypothetical protein
MAAHGTNYNWGQVEAYAFMPKMRVLPLLLFKLGHAGVCASVVGTALLASAAYLILRRGQGPAAQLAALRTMATSTAGLTGGQD